MTEIVTAVVTAAVTGAVTASATDAPPTLPAGPVPSAAVERVSLAEALRKRDSVLAVFVTPEGTLRSMPARHAKRLVVLDWVAQRFEPGERYDEPEVNRRLREVYPDDVASLRRYLVEEGFLDRSAGCYWRIGGTVEAG